ncbi:hypothetical protein TIFTF001_026670 [Ficus carica]|uniref:Uncharacterized protein n=1 Tax=Ficus carica TaxID=3494 RepID=A0AA88DLN7_FICCA|nr:hypothetical protein TIFTF001_026670 [Ficus carica]
MSSSSSEGGNTIAWEIALLCVPNRDPRRNEFALTTTRSMITIVLLLGGCADDAGDSSQGNCQSGEALRFDEHRDDDWVHEGR